MPPLPRRLPTVFESTPANLEPMPDRVVEVGVYATYGAAFEHAVVVVAMGLPCWVLPDAAEFRLWVEVDQVEAIRRQLACFDRESAHWPPKPLPEPASRRLPFAGPLLWSLLVLAVFWGEAAHPEWIDRGALDGAAMLEHREWWRAFTALFLHADMAHVVANGIAGIFVFSAVLAAFGRRSGWILLVVSGVLGNLLAAVLHDRAYHSIGASTAVFAGVGLLTGRAIRRLLAARTGRRLRAVMAPVAAGLAMLGLYGAGGFQVDVLAHATGFAAGLVLAVGVPVAYRRR